MKVIRSVLATLAAVSAAALAGAVSAQNLVQNPGFDLNTPLQGAPLDWTLTPAATDSLFAVAGVVARGGGPNISPSPPNVALFGAYGPDDDELSQVVATTPGQRYVVSFELAHFVPGPDDNDFSAWFGGDELLSMSTTSKFLFTLETFTVEATSSSTTLAFSGRDVLGFYGIDNVSVEAAGAPEPAAWAMMLIGLGAVGAAMRSRRRGLVAA